MNIKNGKGCLARLGRRGNKHSDVVRERERYSELWWKVAVPDALSFKKSCSGARNAEAGTN